MCRVPELNSVGRARQVRQRGHQPVELDRLGRRLARPQATRSRKYCGVSTTSRLAGAAAGSGRRRCAARSTRTAGRRRGRREVELAGVVLDERRRLVADQPLGVAERDRLAERRDALVADLLVDVAGQQPCREPGVLRLLADHLRGGLDGQPVQLGGAGAVVEAADGAGGDPHRVDLGQVVADPVDGPDDLVDVDGLGVAVALAHLHGRASRWAARGCGVTVMSLSSRVGPGRSGRAGGRRTYDE